MGLMKLHEDPEVDSPPLHGDHMEQMLYALDEVEIKKHIKEIMGMRNRKYLVESFVSQSCPEFW